MVFLFSQNLSAYPGCCYNAKIYHKEWEKIGKYMKKFYTQAAQSTRRSKRELDDALPYLLYRSTNLISALGYTEIFDSSNSCKDNLMKEYMGLYYMSTGPQFIDKILAGEDASKLLSHPPRIEKSLMDFVVRGHNGAKSKGVLYGNQHLTKQEIAYVKKEKMQLCANNDLEIRKLEGDIQMLELALAKLAILSGNVVAKEKEERIK